jgi:uncharacterized protein YggE
MESAKQYKVFLAAAVLIAGFIAAVSAAGNLANSGNSASAQVMFADPDEAGHTGAAKAGEQTLSVSGTATAKAQPNKVQLVFAVDTVKETAKEALDVNAETTNAVLVALGAAGVKGNETSTADFNINPVYEYNSWGNVQNLTGYTVTNSILVSSYNLNDTSKWIDAAVGAGANRIDGVNFQLSNEKTVELRNSLILGAIKDAREKADLAAGAVGMEIVGVKSLVINDSGHYPNPYAYPSEIRLSVAADSGSPIIAASQDVSASVNVVYLLG